MPQTADAINTVDAVVEVSADGATWTNVSGTTNKVEITPQTADSGSRATAEGAYKIVRRGKYNPVQITFTALFTETASEFYELLNARKAIGTWYFRYTPGGYNGNYRWYTGDSNGNKAAARIVEFPYPNVDTEDAAATVVVLKLETTQLVRENATPSPSASVSPSASSST